MKKIRSKIISAIVVSNMLLASLIGIISIFQGSNVISSESKDNLINITKSNANLQNIQLKQTEDSVNGIVNIVASKIDMSKISDPNYLNYFNESLKSVVKKFLSDAKGSMDEYIILDPNLVGKVYENSYIIGNGNLQEQNELGIEEFNEDNPNMAWYYDPIKVKGGVWSNPYVDENIKINMVTYSKPVFINGKLIGVVGTDINFDTFKKNILDTKLYNSGYAFLLNSKYDFLVHSKYTSKYNLKTIDNGKYADIVNYMAKSSDGIYDSNFGGKDMVLSYSKLINGTILVNAVPKSEIMASVYTTIKMIVIVIIAGVMICILVAWHLGNRISNPITQIVRLIEKTSNFDLVYDQSYESILKLKDEVGDMAKATVNMRKELRTIVKRLELFSSSVFDISKDVTQSTVDVSANIEELSKTISEISAGASNQAVNAAEGTSQLSNLSDEIDTIVNNSKVIKKYIGIVEKTSKEGNKALIVLQKKFDEDKILELSQSIKEYGIIQPLVVNKIEDNIYGIIVGERRWRAAKLANIKEIPVIIMNLSDNEILEVSLIENIQRQDLNPIEEALAYKKLVTDLNLTQEELSNKIGKSRTKITNCIRLLNLDDRVQNYLIDGAITEGHGRALLGLVSNDLQYKLARTIIDKNLTVRAVEKLIKNFNLHKKPPQSEIREQNIYYLDIKDKLENLFGTKVSLMDKNVSHETFLNKNSFHIYKGYIVK